MRVRLLMGLILLGTLNMNAQKFGDTPEDSITCIQNLSLGNERYGQKMYDDALTFYKIVLDVCPKARKGAYVKVAKLYGVKIKKAKGNPELKDALVDTLMMVYDKRIENFAQRGYVLEKKGRDHLKFRPKQPELSYELFEEAYKLRGNKMGAGAIVYMYKARYSMFKMGKCEKTDVIELYPQLKAIADYNIKNGKKEKSIANYKTSADNLLQFFKEVANCEDLVTAFKPKFEASPNDVEIISGILQLLNAKECEETDFYILVAKRLQELSPSPLAAWSIASWYVKKQQCPNAVDYFFEAFALADSLPEIEKAPFKIKAALKSAECYMSIGQYAKAKLMANKALSVDRSNGKAYMIMGDAYYYGSKSWGTNDCEKRYGYWAAVDKYQVALAKDPSLKEKLGAKISKAKSQFSTQNDCFFYGINEGSSVTIGGWINETTSARFN